MLSLNSLLTQASKINKQIAKVKSKATNDEQADLMATTEKKILMHKLKQDIYTMLELKNMIQEIEQETGEQLLITPQGQKQAYFITIRPDASKISFIDFYNQVKHFVDRKCFKQFKLAFEQKGTTEETLGEGFHVHIVADMSQRSKGEVLRDTQSSFSNCTAPNCIQVLTTKNPQELVDKYLVNYESDDGHKEPTKQWDALWRTRANLESLYVTPLPIKSVLATSKISTTITWN